MGWRSASTFGRLVVVVAEGDALDDLDLGLDDDAKVPLVLLPLEPAVLVLAVLVVTVESDATVALDLDDVGLGLDVVSNDDDVKVALALLLLEPVVVVVLVEPVESDDANDVVVAEADVIVAPDDLDQLGLDAVSDADDDEVAIEVNEAVLG